VVLLVVFRGTFSGFIGCAALAIVLALWPFLFSNWIFYWAGCLLAVLAFSCFLIGLVVCLGCWPFLVFLLVYWRRPYAGQHSLSLRPQRK
jgi:hypothetical protein